jgi:hypothetical protein
LLDFKRRRFADFGAELLAEPGYVVGKDGGFVARARDGDVAESGAKQIWMGAGIGVD